MGTHSAGIKVEWNVLQRGHRLVLLVVLLLVLLVVLLVLLLVLLVLLLVLVLLLLATCWSLLHPWMLGALLNRRMGLGRRLLLLLLQGLLGLLVKGVGRGRFHWQVAGVQGNPLKRTGKL